MFGPTKLNAIATVVIWTADTSVTDGRYSLMIVSEHRDNTTTHTRKFRRLKAPLHSTVDGPQTSVSM
jgi:hypothetical protein